MKTKLLSLVAILLFIATNAYSQDDIYFKVYKSYIVSSETKEILNSYNVDFLLKVNDNYVVAGKNYFTVTSKVVNVSKNEFYVYANHEEFGRCRIHFNISNVDEVLIGIEYRDYTVIYMARYVQ